MKVSAGLVEIMNWLRRAKILMTITTVMGRMMGIHAKRPAGASHVRRQSVATKIVLQRENMKDNVGAPAAVAAKKKQQNQKTQMRQQKNQNCVKPIKEL